MPHLTKSQFEYARVLLQRVKHFQVNTRPWNPHQADGFNCGVLSTMYVLYMAMGWVPFSDLVNENVKKKETCDMIRTWMKLVLASDGSVIGDWTRADAFVRGTATPRVRAFLQLEPLSALYRGR